MFHTEGYEDIYRAQYPGLFQSLLFGCISAVSEWENPDVLLEVVMFSLGNGILHIKAGSCHREALLPFSVLTTSADSACSGVNNFTFISRLAQSC